MQDLDTIRRVARYYPYFQGFRLVPWGVAILADRALSAAWATYLTWQPFGFLALIALATIAGVRIDRSYERAVGFAASSFRPAEAAALAAALVAMVLAGVLDARHSPPVSLFALTLGLVFVIAAFRLARTHFAVAGAVLLVIGLLPVIGVATNVQAYVLSGWATGVSLVALGVLDHRWLDERLARTSA